MSRVFKRILSNKLGFMHIAALVRNSKHVTCLQSVKSTIHKSLSTTQKSVYLIDESDSDGNNEKTNTVNRYTTRTHTCGELNIQNVGEKVVLCGWLEYQRMNKFVVLRDSYGEIQLLVTDEDKSTQKDLEHIPYETIIQIRGTVLSRPKDMINKKQQTGEIEVKVENLKIVNKAKDILPFNIREFQKAKEALRMQFRYLDIRFPQMQRNLRMRSKLFMKMREFLIQNSFIDVETPTLFKATPGGAQEFIVPTRFPGKFYSLVQSPQQFKQMLMAGALDRYFQIAKCYRDEGARSDRQPEFTQLDIELSFTNVDGVLQLIEELLFYSLADVYDGVPRTFEKMPYEQALENYGSDKPDVSFGFQLQNCTAVLKNNKILNTTKDFGAYILVFGPDKLQNCILTKAVKDQMSKVAAQYPKAKLIQSKVTKNDWSSKMSKVFSNQETSNILDKFIISDNSVMFIAYGSRNDARTLLGKIRLEYVNFLEENFQLSLRKKGLHFLWVVDFPLFEMNEEIGQLQSAHHPFTAPHPDDLELLEKDAIKVRALAYDLVLNGNEVGGGSIRIHVPKLQTKVLEVLQINQDSLQHIIDMLGSGCPPHGGIALGLDRLLAILLNATSIRDVIAFPKTFEGKDPVSQAPSEVSEETLKLYHIKTVLNDSKR